jgi:hypothetical protein
MPDVVKIVEVFQHKIWIESDIMGSKHVMIQHDDNESEPFEYCSFRYDYRYTSNSTVLAQAKKLAFSLGAKDPIEIKSRPYIDI